MSGSQTAPGQRDSASDAEPPLSAELIDAINTLFTEFEVAFPNLYHRAYPTDTSLRLAKQLWLNSLRRFSPSAILRAAQKAIESSDYIPTIRTLLRFCEGDRSAYGLPEPRNAYIEACLKPEPKALQAWSHPAVYHAGRESGWFFLANTIEPEAFPVFERNYLILCERVVAGELLDLPIPKAIPQDIPERLSNEERKQRLATMRKALGI